MCPSWAESSRSISCTPCLPLVSGRLYWISIDPSFGIGKLRPWMRRLLSWGLTSYRFPERVTTSRSAGTTSTSTASEFAYVNLPDQITDVTGVGDITYDHTVRPLAECMLLQRVTLAYSCECDSLQQHAFSQMPDCVIICDVPNAGHLRHLVRQFHVCKFGGS